MLGRISVERLTEEAARARGEQLELGFQIRWGKKNPQQKEKTNDLQELVPKDFFLAETHAQKHSVSAALPHRFHIETDRVATSAHCWPMCPFRSSC